MTTPGDRFNELVSIMAQLRSPDGCPWDREQTLASLRPYLLEETYEALEALDNGDMGGLCEELGDLLLEVVFLSRIAEESGRFSVTDAIDAIVDKLVRRHPHVFGADARLSTPHEVRGKWEEMKASERLTSATPKTILGGVPKTLPSLLRAYEYGARAAAVGFDWQRASDVVEKIDEEVRELREAINPGNPGNPGNLGNLGNLGNPGNDIEEEVGDLLFAIANLSRKLGVEPEAALRRANDKFLMRFSEVERRITARGQRLQEKTLDELEATWQEVKRSVKDGATLDR
jgi:tetrapyrrole methylase family protein / MazG family protein